MTAPSVGILGYQGCIEPHEAIFDTLGIPCRRVKTPADLASVDRLILPGGESTTMLRFLRFYGMESALQDFARHHRVWGICAGSILIASQVTNPPQDCLALMDIAAHRNFYGSQADSFTTKVTIDLCRNPIEAHFIRAPLLTPLHPQKKADALQIHAYHRDTPVFFSQGNIWACSFHVELGGDHALHEAFVS